MKRRIAAARNYQINVEPTLGEGVGCEDARASTVTEEHDTAREPAGSQAQELEREERVDELIDGVDEHVAPQVALGRRPVADEVRLVGGAHVRAPPVGVREDGDAADPELAERPEHADRDLAAVGDEDLREGRHMARILPEP